MPQVTKSPNSNPFCVPAALSALIGLHVDKVIELIESEIGKQPISGILYPLALKILRDLGYRFREISLKASATRGAHFTEGKTYLICQPRHVGVIEGKLYIDNFFPQGTECPQRLRIIKIFEVWKDKEN